MRYPIPRHLLVAAVVAAGAACDNIADPEADAPPSPPIIASPDEIATYRGLVDAIDEALQSYQLAVLDPQLTFDECRAAFATYDTTARHPIERMIGLGEEMDAFMYAHGGAFVADMQCVPRLMMSELDSHSHVACMWSTSDRNRAESLRHAGVMARYVGHLDQRVEEMTSGMNGEGWGWNDPMCN